MRVDLDEAERLASAAGLLLSTADDLFAAGRVERAVGHVHALRSRLVEAMAAYDSALARFETGGHDLEGAITRSGALQTLIYLGRYGEALEWAGRARQVFTVAGDRLRLGRLEANVGNILYRQDRFDEALACYTRALGALRVVGDPQDVAVALRNLAVCHISLHDFAKAVATYHEARAWCHSQGLLGLVAEVDYNVAYVFYLRGEYGRAIELYRVARERSLASGDRYHAALCDLDQSELYLEINLLKEGEALARRAEASFRALGMGYERAKALVNLAVAQHRRGRSRAADLRFIRARKLFVAEGNQIWPSLIDLYRAFVLERVSPERAERLCDEAHRFFSGTALSSKLALSQLLLARLRAQRGRVSEAAALGEDAFARCEQAGLPALAYQAAFTLGELCDARGDGATGYEWYRRAHGILDALRGRLRHDELKIAFLSDKQRVFEHLVTASLSRESGGGGAREAFAWMEQAKSRSLAEHIAAQAQALPLPMSVRPDVGSRFRELRERLHWCHKEIERTEAEGRQHASDRLSALRREAQQWEGELVQLFQELGTGAGEFVALQTAEVVRLEAVQATLPEDAALLEYYEAQGRLYLALLRRDAVEVVPLGAAAEAYARLEFFRFQMSKFRLGGEYVARFAPTFERAAQAHLSALYDLTLRPVRARLSGVRQLIVVPHRRLHHLPFPALYDGQRFVVDDFAISYAPSASVLHYCCTKPASRGRHALVLGVADERLPAVPREVRAVAAALPDARLYVGADATESRLRDEGAEARYVHIATHGVFREDSPLFSSIRLADRFVTLFDLYYLRLDAELVTLSGCGTGLSVVVGGDELIGLTRGLLFAGARSVLLTLWDVHDEGAALLMEDFYRRLSQGEAKAQALAAAMRAVRARWPHPYYWASFALAGAPA